ncbi:hypothetical protein Emed_001329 [Eimeria media]
MTKDVVVQQPLIEQKNIYEFLKHFPASEEQTHDFEAVAADSSPAYTQAELAQATRSASRRRPFLGVFAAATSIFMLAALLSTKKLLVGEEALEKTKTESVLLEDKPKRLSSSGGSEEVKEEVEHSLAEIEEKLESIVEWARQTRAPKDRSFARKDLEAKVVEFYRDGLRYRVTAGFRSRFHTFALRPPLCVRYPLLLQALTPSYDPVKTAAALKEGLANLFERCKNYEKDILSGRRTPVPDGEFGDEENGSIAVTFTVARAGTRS